MKQKENGFTVIEMVVAFSLSAMIALAGMAFVFQSINTADRTEDHLTVVAAAENAGYWLSRDAYMADNVITDNLTSPAILVLKWTEWGYGDTNIYHSATYSIENLSDNIGHLTRHYQSSSGTDQQTTIASNIYYNPSDPTNTTSISYLSPVINLKVSTKLGDTGETRNYQIYRRPNF